MSDYSCEFCRKREVSFYDACGRCDHRCCYECCDSVDGLVYCKGCIVTQLNSMIVSLKKSVRVQEEYFIKEIEMMKKKIEELECCPPVDGGRKYLEAKEHFESGS